MCWRFKILRGVHISQPLDYEQDSQARAHTQKATSQVEVAFAYHAPYFQYYFIITIFFIKSIVPFETIRTI